MSLHDLLNECLKLCIGHLIFNAHFNKDRFNLIQFHSASQSCQHSHHLLLVYATTVVSIINEKYNGSRWLEIAVWYDIYQMVKFLEVKCTVAVLIELLKNRVKFFLWYLNFNLFKYFHHFRGIQTPILAGVECIEYGSHLINVWYIAHF